MGLGKPLGFGSVRAEIVPDGTRVADGNAWAAVLADWNPSGPTPCELEPMRAEFKTEITRAESQPAAVVPAGRRRVRGIARELSSNPGSIRSGCGALRMVRQKR